VTHGNVGSSCSFTISPQSAEGRVVQVPSNAIQVLISGPHGSVSSSLSPDPKGYNASYLPTKVGPHAISITLFGKEIWKGTNLVKQEQTPPTPTPASTGTTALKCSLKGAGLKKGTAKAINSFTVTVLENNTPKHVPDAVGITVTGPSVVTTTIIDNNDGSYKVSYKPDLEGIYEVNISLFDKNILPRPLRAQIAAVPKKLSCKLKGTGLKNGILGNNSFTASVTQDGAPLSITGNPIEVFITGPSSIVTHVKHIGNGEYECTYGVRVPGTYQINMHLFDKAILGKPLSVVIS